MDLFDQLFADFPGDVTATLRRKLPDGRKRTAKVLGAPADDSEEAFMDAASIGLVTAVKIPGRTADLGRGKGLKVRTGYRAKAVAAEMMGAPIPEPTPEEAAALAADAKARAAAKAATVAPPIESGTINRMTDVLNPAVDPAPVLTPAPSLNGTHATV